MGSAVTSSSNLATYSGDSPWTPRNLRYYFAQKTTNAGSLTNGGGGATFTMSGTGSDLTNSSGNYASYATAASNNGFAGASATTVPFRRNHYPDLVTITHTHTAAQATLRIWVGLWGSGFAGATTDDGGAGKYGMLFRYSPAAGDTNWMVVVNDGTTSAAVSTGVAFADNTRYVFRIRVTPTAAYFYVNGTLTNTVTANLPGVDVDLAGFVAGIYTNEAVAKSLGLSLVALEMR